jgi:hypothetical protein
VNVLIDHNISPHIARALAAMAGPAGDHVVAKSEKFDTTRPIRDVDWLESLGREGGWAFISDDQRIHRNPQERAAMLAAQVIGFFLEPAWRKSNVTEFERAARLLLWWAKLMSQCEIVAPPAAFRVPFNPSARLRSLPLPRR